MTKYNLKVDGRVVYEFESDQTPQIEAVARRETRWEFGAVYHDDKRGYEVRFLGYNRRGDGVFVGEGRSDGPSLIYRNRDSMETCMSFVRELAGDEWKVVRLP